MRLELKTQQETYIETEIGLLPESWEIVKFDRCIVKKIISTGKIKQQEYKKSGNYKIVDQGQYLIAGYWDNYDDVYKGELPIIIFGDHTRILKYIDFPFVCGADGTKIISPDKSRFNPKYIFYYLMSLKIPSRGYNRHYSLLKEQRIICPPIPEQEKIAYVLSAIHEAKEKTEIVINALRELKKSTMKHLFTYGAVSLKEAEKVKLKETQIGLIPDDWEIERLGNAIEFSRKPRGFSLISNLEIPFIPMDFIYENNQNVRSWFMKKSSEISSGTFVLKEDLIVAKITPCFENGKQAILNNLPLEYGYATTEVWAFHPKNGKVLTEYIYYYLKIDSIRIELASKMEGTTGRKRLPRHVLENMLIPYPLVHEQEKIVSNLSTVDMRIESEENKRKSLEELFKSMLHNLMTAKIRVNHIEIEDA